MRASLLFVRKGTRRRRNFRDEIAFETGYVSRVVTLRRLLLYRPRSPAVVIDTDLQPAKESSTTNCCQRGLVGEKLDRAGLPKVSSSQVTHSTYSSPFSLPSITPVLLHPAASTHEIPPVDKLCCANETVADGTPPSHPSLPSTFLSHPSQVPSLS
jgi:hypothetical protein